MTVIRLMKLQLFTNILGVLQRTKQNHMRSLFFSVIAIWVVGFFLARAIVAINYSYPLDIVEGILLDQLSRADDLKQLYPTEFSAPPYVPTAYPPGFYWVVYPFYNVFGNVLWYGRLLNVLSFLGSSVVIGLFIKKITGKLQAATFASIFFLAIPYVVNWSSLFRVDGLALFLTLLSLYLISKDQKHASAVKAGLASFAAGMVKHSFLIASTAAIFGWLLFQKKYRAAKSYALAVLLPSVVLGLILEAWTKGGFLFNIIVINAKMEIAPGHLFGYLGEFFLRNPYLLSAIVLFLITQKRYKHEVMKTPIALYAIFSLVSVGGIVKAGSNVNYFLEFSAAISLIIGLAISRLTGKKNHFEPIFVGLICLQIITNNFWYFYHQSFIQTNYRFQKNYLELGLNSREMATVLSRITKYDLPVLADDAVAALVPLVNRRMYIEPFAMTQMSKNQLWQEKPLIEAIKNHKFPYIFITSYVECRIAADQCHFHRGRLSSVKDLQEQNMYIWWTTGMYKAIFEEYAVEEIIGDVLVFTPKRLTNQ